jgi:hypothetical protein
MKNFNELFETAKTVADRRKKVFKQLIEKTKNEILPKFCETCEEFDIKTVFGITQNRLFDEQSGQEFEYDWTGYPFAINVKEKTMSGCDYFAPSGDYNLTDYEDLNISDVKFKRTAIMEFVTLLNSRLADYVNKYDHSNNEAEQL